jgi:hypothetical protein
MGNRQQSLVAFNTIRLLKFPSRSNQHQPYPFFLPKTLHLPTEKLAPPALTGAMMTPNVGPPLTATTPLGCIPPFFVTLRLVSKRLMHMIATCPHATNQIPDPTPTRVDPSIIHEVIDTANQKDTDKTAVHKMGIYLSLLDNQTNLAVTTHALVNPCITVQRKTYPIPAHAASPLARKTLGTRLQHLNR